MPAGPKAMRSLDEDLFGPTRTADPAAPARTAEAGDAAAARWAASGAAGLSGHPDGPPLPVPAGLVDGLTALAARLARHEPSLAGLDPLALLGERAALDTRMGRRGRTTVGGGGRLLPTGDGWLSLTLARPSDLDLLPAWLGLDPTSPEGAAIARGWDEAGARTTDAAWQAVARLVAGRPSVDLAPFGAELGLPLGVLGEVTVDRPAVAAHPLPPPDASADGPGAPTTADRGPRPLAGALVVDLSALWAGPLCTSLLAQAGATVLKVESPHRPDGARFGDQALFDLLNAGKRSVAPDLRTPEGRAELQALLLRADVVVESSRPRALQALGLDRDQIAPRARHLRVWATITGHGRHGEAALRTAFGDDAAVAGRLVTWDPEGRPCYCADAVADPASGLATAAAIADRLATGGRWAVDVTMAAVARHLSRGPLLAAAGPLAPPRARPRRGSAPALGEAGSGRAWAAPLDGEG